MENVRYSIRQLDYNYADDISNFIENELNEYSDKNKQEVDLQALRVFVKYVDIDFAKRNLLQSQVIAWACFSKKEMIGLLLSRQDKEIITLSREREGEYMVARALLYTMYHYNTKTTECTTMRAQVPRLCAHLYERFGWVPTGEKGQAGCVAMEYDQTKIS